MREVRAPALMVIVWLVVGEKSGAFVDSMVRVLVVGGGCRLARFGWWDNLIAPGETAVVEALREENEVGEKVQRW